jgi:hypothetical protein
LVKVHDKWPYVFIGFKTKDSSKNSRFC